MTFKEAVVQTITQQKLTGKDKKFLDRVVYGDWVQNPKTGLIDVDGNVYLSYENLTKIPYKFGKVNGYFYCNNNQLTTLEGAPIKVEGNFSCNNNKLTSLKGCPKIIKGYFICAGNQLQSTKYLPSMIINYNECINDINNQKIKYLIDMGFDPDDRKLFKELMTELD